MSNNPFYTESESVSTLSLRNDSFVLLLHNDEVNTFDHVIDSLVDVCEHDPIQAEQCAFIVHYKGKCDVMHGSMVDLSARKTALCDRGLDATIERN